MAQKKVYLLLKITIAPNLIKEFSELWAKESLPLWLEHGARHLGSFVNYIGGSTNEIIRLFEFDDIAHWERWEEYYVGNDEIKELRQKLFSYGIIMENKLLQSI